MSGVVAGVDGCRAGYVVALRRLDDGAWLGARVVPDVAALLSLPDAPCIIAIDMPIGLPERVAVGGRAPERLVRPLLGARQSSVFAVPGRAAVMAADYGQACAAALATSDPPRKVSKQAFHLFPKMRELDERLRADPAACERVFETHPELAFRLMAGAPLVHPKKIKGVVNPPGMAERLALLAREGLVDRPARLPGAGTDDVLDAHAAAWTALRIARGEALRFPDPPEHDAHGLTVAIHG